MRTLLLMCLMLLSCVSGEPVALPDDPGGGALPERDPGWLSSAVGYEVFVRSFADGNADGQGDLAGLTGRLDYLAKLGINLLWLTPIYPSPSYHGYDITDYQQVHPELGTLEGFDALVAGARRRGIQVILDLVVNHTSNRHPWFLAAQGDAAQRGRYLFRDGDPGWQFQGRKLWKPLPGEPGRFYFGFFSSALPDLNFRDPRVEPAMEEAMAFWLRRGIAGFRLDAARYVVESPDPQGAPAAAAPAFADTAETHALWRRLRQGLARTSPGAVMVGEVWTDLAAISRYHGAGAELHGCFHFPLAGALVDGVRRDDARPIRDALQATARAGVPLSFLAPFLSNHDQERVATSWGKDPARLRLGAALLLAMPGPPFLYYGEEVGLGQSQEAGDRAKRAPMPWGEVAAQEGDPGSLLARYRELIRLRRATPALGSDALQVLQPSHPDAADALLAVARGRGAGAVIAVYNLSGKSVSGARLPLPNDYPTGPVRDLLSTDALPVVSADNRQGYPLPPLAPRSARWISLSGP